MRKIVTLALVSVAVVACGQTKLLGKSLPDETQVVDGPTLALPPSFELRPPRDAKDYEGALRVQQQADVQGMLTGVSATVPAAGSAAQDAWLVDKVGAGQADIRAQLEQDAALPKEEKKQGLFGKWFGKDNDE